jgi:hypothetical protein
MAAAAHAASLRMIDTGANLLDAVYMGVHNDKQAHPPDLDAVLQRAWDAGAGGGGRGQCRGVSYRRTTGVDWSGHSLSAEQLRACSHRLTE